MQCRSTLHSFHSSGASPPHLFFVGLRLQGALQFPIALFVLAMVAVAEATLSAER